MKITPNTEIIQQAEIDCVTNRLTVNDCLDIFGQRVSYEIKNWMTGQWYRTTHKVNNSFLDQMEQGKIRNVILCGK